MTRLTATLAFALCLAAPTTVLGQAPTAAERFAAINARVPAPVLTGVRQAIDAAEGDCRPTGYSLGPVEPVTAWGKIDEAIAEGQLANAWTVTITRVGCDQPHARYLVMQAPDGGLIAQLLHPGRSHVDLHNLTDGVMSKAMRVAANTAGRDIPGCSSELIARTGRFVGADIVDDSRIGPPAFGLRASGGWRESWLFSVCGRELSVFITFAGGEDGVTATAAGWASLKR